MKYLLTLALSFIGIAHAAVTEPPSAPAVVWRHVSSHSYEAEYPGFGTSHKYSSASGWIDVYVYSLGRSDWAPGVGDPKFAEHFLSTIDEVRQYAAERGFYTELEVGPIQDVIVSGQAFRTVRFRYSRDGKPMHSKTYLTARNGQLLKYRISVFAASAPDVDFVARAFVEETLLDDPTAKKQ
jgi:hypothetical protein